MSTTVKMVQFISDGLVRCPVRHADVDVERCLGCRRREDIDLDSRQPHVVCQIESEALDCPQRGSA